MSTQTSYEGGRLVVTRTYDTPRETLFEAWVDTSKVENWWGCADTTHVKSQVEPKLAGKYVHKMTLRQSFEQMVEGVISEYDPPATLAYEVSGPSQDKTMTIKVEFIEQGPGTLIRLTHDNIPHQFSEFVTDGWSAAFGKLYRFLMEQKFSA